MIVAYFLTWILKNHCPQEGETIWAISDIFERLRNVEVVFIMFNCLIDYHGNSLMEIWKLLEFIRNYTSINKYK